MIKSLLVALLLTSSLFGNSFFKQDDKQQHMKATALIAFMSSVVYSELGYTPTEVFWMSLGTALAVGVVKELSDDEFSGQDMVANAIGGTVGAIPMFVLCSF